MYQIYESGKDYNLSGTKKLSLLPHSQSSIRTEFELEEDIEA
jgi:hypothetical protein